MVLFEISRSLGKRARKSARERATKDGGKFPAASPLILTFSLQQNRQLRSSYLFSRNYSDMSNWDAPNSWKFFLSGQLLFSWRQCSKYLLAYEDSRSSRPNSKCQLSNVWSWLSLLLMTKMKMWGKSQISLWTMLKKCESIICKYCWKGFISIVTLL